MKNNDETKEAIKKWLEAYRKKFGEQCPTQADVDHSSYLERLLGNEGVLDDPPPRAFSYPWVSLIQDEGAEKCEISGPYEDYMAGHLSINQSFWKIVEQYDENTYLVEWQDTMANKIVFIHPMRFVAIKNVYQSSSPFSGTMISERRYKNEE